MDFELPSPHADESPMGRDPAVSVSLGVETVDVAPAVRAERPSVPLPFDSIAPGRRWFPWHQESMTSLSWRALFQTKSDANKRARTTAVPLRASIQSPPTETATRWMGYMDGAVDSGQRAANEVLAAL